MHLVYFIIHYYILHVEITCNIAVSELYIVYQTQCYYYLCFLLHDSTITILIEYY